MISIDDPEKYQRMRDAWLKDYDRSEGDVVVENGREFIYVEEEDRMRRVEVPRSAFASIEDFVDFLPSFAKTRLGLLEDVRTPEGRVGKVSEFDEGGRVKVRSGSWWRWYKRDELSRV